MPHIRPDCAEQSATNLLIEHRRKPNGLAARLTRDVLLLHSAGSSRRAIATTLNLSQRRVQTILNAAAPASQANVGPSSCANAMRNLRVSRQPFSRSTMRAEHLRYATRCPAPYSYSHFWRRFEDGWTPSRTPTSGPRYLWRD